jgi:hypothetical protein
LGRVILEISAINYPPQLTEIVLFVPVKVGCEIVPLAVVEPVSCALVPVKVGCETLPFGVPEVETSPSSPVNVAV